MFFPVFVPFSLVLIVLLNESKQVCGSTSDLCDWTGSGLHADVTKSVQSLYLRCREGSIKWQYPRGALRAVLTPLLPHFRGCVKIKSSSSGGTLYLEGREKLFSLYRTGDGKSEGLLRCFTSRNGQVALYIEADPPVDIMRKDTIEFQYDLVAQEHLENDMEECRPCTDDEILHAFCSTDFVVHGVVTSLAHNEATQWSEITVLVMKVIRDTPQDQWSNSKYVTLHRPLKCGTKVGKGEFMFFGRQQLGQLIITCAPRFVHWKEIRRKALEAGTNQCQLS